MSKNNGNNDSSSKTEVKITCCNTRKWPKQRGCGKRFSVKVGKNDGSLRTVNCPHCGKTNRFTVDENGKVHGPAAI
ncbi:MAG: hypothetical protein ABH919_00165 [bacterium]